MVKLKVTVVCTDPDGDDEWDAHAEIFGKDASNLWILFGDATIERTDGLSGALYGALVAEAPENGEDVENPFA